MKFSTQKFDVFQSPSGSVESITLYEFDSGKPGPEVFLQASVHGAEVQGNLVLFFLTQKCSEKYQQGQFTGKIRFVPLANPRATNQKIGTATFGRFNPVSGHNWNRNYSDLAKIIDFPKFVANNKLNDRQSISENFKKHLYQTLETQQKKDFDYGPDDNKKLNLLLQKLACSADIVLDLHTGPIACRYLYAAEYLKEKSRDLLFPFTISIPHEFAGAMDEACFMPWIKLEEECQRQNVDFQNPFEAYTVELSSEERVCSKMAQEDLARLSHFLFIRNVFGHEEKHVIKDQQWIAPLHNYKTYRSFHAGLCEFVALPGQILNKGDLIARIYLWHKVSLDESGLPNVTEAVQEIHARQRCAIINHTTSAVVSEGMELYQALEDLQAH